MHTVTVKSSKAQKFSLIRNTQRLPVNSENRQKNVNQYILLNFETSILDRETRSLSISL